MEQAKMAENTVQRLRDDIENGILTGAFLPGERLDEVQLATRYGVSRTPIREALIQLGAIGLIEIRPRRGAVVIKHGPQRIYEMFEVMAELEGLAGALAAQRHTNEDRDAILASHARCKISAESEDADAYYYDNEAFHRSIYAASHNEFLEEQAIVLHRRLRPYRRLQLRVRNRMRNSFTEHGQIVEAILANDAEATRSLLRNHIVIQGDRFANLLATLAKHEVPAKRETRATISK